ncbi:MAG: D-glycero-alpha-D-manno-heptose-1,7-bisphosphate 7-phosphatase [Bacteriovoracaceae bacterium]
MKTRKAIFLDRDGTLILDKNYLSRVEDMEYFPDTLKALHLLQQLGYDLFIVTNQSGVGRGYFALESVYVIHRQLQNDLREQKLSPFKDFAICPHSPDEGCECRKPSGQMILDLMKKYNISAEHSWMIGDKIIDAEAGKNAGIKSALVRMDSKDFPSFKTLLDFAQSLNKKDAV